MPQTAPPRNIDPQRPARRPDAAVGVRPPRIDAETGWVVRHRVPILDVHDHPTKGKVDEGTLRLLAKNSNDRCRVHNYALLTIGHTDDDGAEVDQPPLVGFARNFTVDRYTDHRGTRPCLYADFHLQPGEAPRAFTFPHRSVERVISKDRERNAIEAIALLRRAPERHLGLLTYSRSRPGDRVVRYARDLPPVGRGGPGPQHDPERGDAMGLDMGGGDIRQIIKEAVKEVLSEYLDGASGGDPADGPPGDDLGDDLPPEDGLDAGPDDEPVDAGGPPPADDMGGADEPPPPPPGEEEDPEVERHAMGEPSCGSEFVPGQVGKKKYARSGGDTILARYARELEQKDDEIVRLRADLQAEKVRYARDQKRRKVLQGLVEVGYNLDVEDELADTVRYSDKQFDRYVAKVEAKYERFPLNQAPVSGRSPRPETDDDVSHEDAPSLARYAREAIDKDPGLDRVTALKAALENLKANRIGQQ